VAQGVGHDYRDGRRRLRLSPTIAELVAAIDRLPHIAWSGRAFRHVALPYPPSSGEGARINGGRWNPPNSFATLYFGLSRVTVVAEFDRLATKFGLATSAFLPRVLYSYDLLINDALDLRVADAREALGLDDRALSADPPSLCQQIGDATVTCGREAILAPSATGLGDVLALYIGRLGPGTQLSHEQLERWDAPPSLPT
jgi:RES domain-containing protein